MNRGSSNLRSSIRCPVLGLVMKAPFIANSNLARGFSALEDALSGLARGHLALRIKTQTHGPTGAAYDQQSFLSARVARAATKAPEILSSPKLKLFQLSHRLPPFPETNQV